MITTPEPGSELPPARPRPEALAMLAQRRSCIASQLSAPGPTDAELRDLLRVAARVPDHGKLSPWRFILLQGEHKSRFSRALRKLNPDAGAKELAAIDKLEIPPVSVVVVSRTSACRIPVWEQELSAGAVCMNLLTAACAMGFGGNWITGWYAYDARVNGLLGLAENERVAGFIQIGRIEGPLKERPRSEIDELVSTWHGTD